MFSGQREAESPLLSVLPVRGCGAFREADSFLGIFRIPAELGIARSSPVVLWHRCGPCAEQDFGANYGWVTSALHPTARAGPRIPGILLSSP